MPNVPQHPNSINTYPATAPDNLRRELLALRRLLLTHSPERRPRRLLVREWQIANELRGAR